MDIKSLKYAIALVETGSFIKAAHKLSLTQSGVSRSIIALEEEIGTQLFDRGRNGIQLTESGKVFVVKARQLVMDAEKMKMETLLVDGIVSGKVAIGIVPALSYVIMSSFAQQFMTLEDDLNVSIKVRMRSDLIEALRDESMDFYVGLEDNQPLEPDLESEIIGHSQGGAIFARRQHPLADQSIVSADDVARYPLVVAGVEKHLEDHRNALLNVERGKSVEPKLICDSVQVLKNVLLHSDALLVTGKIAKKELIGGGELVEISAPNVELSKRLNYINIVRLKDRKLSPAMECMISLLKDNIENYISSN